MEVDPPFYQQRTDSSNELELPPRQHTQYGHAVNAPLHLWPTVTRQSSSAGDYRSVIDDLTVENKRLKEQLKRYKQGVAGEKMRKDKLFEIKFHGLANGKKRELEATLRDFAANLDTTTSNEKRPLPGKHMEDLYASREALSKQQRASHSSIQSRPVDSAYASMSNGPSTNVPQSSTGPSLHGRPSLSLSRTMSSDRKVENPPQDTQGLPPRQSTMSDKEKKKLVVRRLEQLFTGKISGRNMHRNHSLPYLEAQNLTAASAILQPPYPEALREARIELLETSTTKTTSRDNVPTLISGGRSDSGGVLEVGSHSIRSANDDSPPAILPEQRPTRPRDLDHNRAQTPSENMDYIRHLGVVRPGFLVDKKMLRHDVAADADGWVFLNLLCNLAQLHMINVTPAFIRSAVSQKSTKFQLSPDGQKIRWRGGVDGTKFSSDSSVDHSSTDHCSDESDGSAQTEQRKRLKTTVSGDAMTWNGSNKSKSRIGHTPASSNGFHYKPLFVRHSSSVQTTSSDGLGSQASGGAQYDKTPHKPTWDVSGPDAEGRRKRRHDGAIIYYSGAPFCIDLSGDQKDVSPATYMTSVGQERDLDPRGFRPIPHRSDSGSSMLVRPLSDDPEIVSEAMDMDLDSPCELVTEEGDFGIGLDLEFPWCDQPTSVAPISFPLEPRLEACGLGGVMPEDHFAVICHTRHPVLKARDVKVHRAARAPSEEVQAIAGQLASMSTTSPAPSQNLKVAPLVQMTYLSGRLRRLNPVALPPAAMFIPPFSTDSETDGYDDELSTEDEGSEEADSSARFMSKLDDPRLSDTAFAAEKMSTNEKESDRHTKMVIGNIKSSSVSTRAQVAENTPTVATAGDEQESGYSSSLEDDASSK